MVEITIGQSQTGFWSPQIVAAIISGLIALLTGTIVAFIAWRQWRTAKDKLALDLFDRRLVAWRLIQKHLKKRIDEILKAHSTGQQPEFVSEHLRSLWVAIDEAHFLFGDDVRRAMTEVDDVIFAWGGADPDEYVERTTQLGRVGKISARHVGLEKLNRARRELRQAVEPYMAMGAIGVARPSPSLNAAIMAVAGRWRPFKPNVPQT